MLITFPSQDSPYKEIIDAIHKFHSSTQFFYWLAQETIDVQIMTESFHQGMYERVMQYCLDGLHIFSVGGHVKFPNLPENLEKIPKPTHHLQKFFFFDFDKFHGLVPFLTQLEKRELSHTLQESSYTVISQLYFKENLAGSIWEIYELANLSKVYNSRKGQLTNPSSATE